MTSGSSMPAMTCMDTLNIAVGRMPRATDLTWPPQLLQMSKLNTQDCNPGDDGLALSEVMTLANESKARNKIIILDSCYSGALGEHPINRHVSEISEGVTILTASTKGQYAAEANGGGVFTGLFIDALGDAAANLIGEVTPGGVYAHIDQSLGPGASVLSSRPT
jgi:hypothetical protein